MRRPLWRKRRELARRRLWAKRGWPIEGRLKLWLKDEIARLDGEIKALGPVNVAALDRSKLLERTRLA